MAKANRGGKKLTVTPGLDVAAAPNVFVIDDDTPKDQLFNPVINGEIKGHGLVPRDYATYPKEMFDPPSDLKLIPRSEWSDRIKEMAANKSRISDFRTFPALDQNGQGYCWAYSTTGAVMLVRAMNNQPYVRLSAHAIGCKVKSFRNEGGWCGLSAKFHREQGCPSVEHWEEKSMSRDMDKPETWANAAKHKVTEDWVDVLRDVYDQNLTFDQVITCLLCRIPLALDYNWWGHSVCGMDAVEVEAGSFGVLELNSWTDGWGDRGTSILRGSKAIPNGAVALRVTGGTPI